MSNYIKKLEAYHDLEVAIIRRTKINKVLKALIKLNTIPKDEEFEFRKRSLELLSQWNKLLGADPPEIDIGEKDSKATPTTNGVHKEKGSEEPADDKKVDAVAPTEQATEPSEETTKPVETEVESKPEPEEPAAEEPKEEAVEEVSKADLPRPEVVDKAPESATAASEVNDLVKASD
jgi:hypothetical protein